jgi:3-methyladenine DNA glycosylase/8-oxoguanine DNA glycosylase
MPAIQSNAKKLVRYIGTLSDFRIVKRQGPCYQHMGATICDTILQAGLSYRTVVAPRINRLMEAWPAAISTSDFNTHVESFDLPSVLKWNDEEKPRRIKELTAFLLAVGLESEYEVAAWLSVSGRGQDLLSVRGVGPKTADYLAGLVGAESVAVDRHIRTFVKTAGIEIREYECIRATVSAAATMMGVLPQELDHAIWQRMSQSRQRSRNAA